MVVMMFGGPSTNHTEVGLPSVQNGDHLISIMIKYGWTVSGMRQGGNMESADVCIEFTPTQQPVEVLRRLMVAGLTRAEAVAFWFTETEDHRWIAESELNWYLMDDSFEKDLVDHYAEATGTTKEAVYMARDNGRSKLEEIDPMLPEHLVENRVGQPLPKEMWAEVEWQRLHRNSGE
jgi:hypothetical protein